MYRYGKGIMQSNKKFYIWNTIAAANDYEEATCIRGEVANNLSPQELEQSAKLYERINNK